MKRKTPAGLILAALASPASATLLIHEPFNYGPAGTEISTADGAGGWLKVPATTTPEPTMGTGSLPQGSLPFAPTGNKVVGNSAGGGNMASSTLAIPGQPYLTADQPTMYYSLLLNVTNVSGLALTNGSFIAGMRNNTSTNGLASFEGAAPLMLRQTATGSGLFQLGTGLTQENADRTWDTANTYSASTGTMLLVLSYQFVTGGEDFARLYVNPDPTMSEAANASALKVTATATDGHGVAQGRITNVFLRNNGTAPDGWEIDELRVSNSWEDLWSTTVLGIWQPGGTGNWNDPNMWSGATVPNAPSIPVNIDNNNPAASIVTLNQDASVRSLALNTGDTLNIDSGRTLTLAVSSTVNGIINSSGTINASGLNVTGATAELHYNAGAVNPGRLQLFDGGKMFMAPGQDKTLLVASNSTIDIVDGSKLDVADNRVVVTAGDIGSWNGSNYTGLTGLIQSGRGDGTWNGSGIVTSMTDATASVLTTLAIGTAEELGYASGTFGGVSVSTGDVLVMYTWGGDADLNGELNGDDYFFIDSNVSQSGSVFGFHNGDFDYNGEINGDDYFIIDSNILQAQGSGIVWPTGAGASGLSSVPEPAAGLLAAGLWGVFARRNRKN